MSKDGDLKKEFTLIKLNWSQSWPAERLVKSEPEQWAPLTKEQLDRVKQRGTFRTCVWIEVIA